ncbi:MAG: hypothetical protein WB783_01170 [Arenicellales bacterium]
MKILAVQIDIPATPTGRSRDIHIEYESIERARRQRLLSGDGLGHYRSLECILAHAPRRQALP